MTVKKPVKPKAPKPHKIPFHAPNIPPEAKLEPVPAVLPPAKETFAVRCKVESVGTHFWSGIVFVALESTDGQNLIDLLREGQQVTIEYKKS